MFEITAATHQGARDYQEDSLYHFQNDDGAFVIVCDGLGGHDRGADASAYAVNFFRDLKPQLEEQLRLINREQEDVAEAFLKRSVLACNVGLAATIKGRPMKEPSTTLICGLITKGKAVLLSIGDSYIYCVDTNHPIPTVLINKLDETPYGSLTQAVGLGIHTVNSYVYDWKQRQLVFASDGLTILPIGGDADYLVKAQLEQKQKHQDNITAVVVTA